VVAEAQLRWAARWPVWNSNCYIRVISCDPGPCVCSLGVAAGTGPCKAVLCISTDPAAGPSSSGSQQRRPTDAAAGPSSGRGPLIGALLPTSLPSVPAPVCLFFLSLPGPGLPHWAPAPGAWSRGSRAKQTATPGCRRGGAGSHSGRACGGPGSGLRPDLMRFPHFPSPLANSELQSKRAVSRKNGDSSSYCWRWPDGHRWV
jgi:hypothetical protein